MADNITLPGAGAVAATDEISSVHYQEMKIVDGTKGNTTPAVVNSAGALLTQPISLAGSILQTVVTVGTTAVTLPASALSNRRTLLVQADMANTAYIFIGSSTVTADSASTGGFQLSAGQSLSIDVANGLAVYGRSTAASQLVRVIEVS